MTKPYTDEQWARILDVGADVDRRLVAGDVRLTMGGEPTFISIDDMDGEEWNTAALGPRKRQLAADLLHRIATGLQPGSLLHFGQGKWYPGESLPRWALSCYWRRDGVPIQQRDDLIAEEGRDYGYSVSSTRSSSCSGWPRNCRSHRSGPCRPMKSLGTTWRRNSACP